MLAPLQPFDEDLPHSTLSWLLVHAYASQTLLLNECWPALTVFRYVVDAGRSKQKLLESNSGAAVARYAVDWVSKAAAEQRAGRAGRTGPGHVYRLYSSAHFNDNFKQHTDPEIANTPLEGVVLLLKAMGVDKVGHSSRAAGLEFGRVSPLNRCFEHCCFRMLLVLCILLTCTLCQGQLGVLMTVLLQCDSQWHDLAFPHMVVLPAGMVGSYSGDCTAASRCSTSPSPPLLSLKPYVQPPAVCWLSVP